MRTLERCLAACHGSKVVLSPSSEELARILDEHAAY